MRRLLDDFLTRLEHSATADETWAETLAFLRSMGFEHSMYACGRLVGPEKQPVLALTNNTYPDWFNARYREENYALHDTALMHCLTQLAPVRLGIEWRPQVLTPMETRVALEVADFGFRSAIIYPLRSSGSNPFAGISIANAMTRDEFARFFPERQLILHLAITCAHTRIQMQIQAEAAAGVHLTPHERECLLWGAMGLTTKEIARQLGLSPRTVDFHILGAMRKLGASTRTHAVARAMALGAIQP